MCAAIDFPGTQNLGPGNGCRQQAGVAERDVRRRYGCRVVGARNRLGRIRQTRATDVTQPRQIDGKKGAQPVVSGDGLSRLLFPHGGTLAIPRMQDRYAWAVRLHRNGNRHATVQATAEKRNGRHVRTHNIPVLLVFAGDFAASRSNIVRLTPPGGCLDSRAMAFKQFDRVPNHYAGAVIQRIKDFRQDMGKRSLAPTLLNVGELEVLVPRHFGFCFGVERAIHMAFSALERHPERQINLLSEIIHNPLVNDDLEQRGIRFIHDSDGQRRIGESEIRAEDVVLIPAFGTTLEIEQSLQRSGIDTTTQEFREHFDTTCPFVSKVWDRGEELGQEGYTIVIHGKFRHEETQATHSHTKEHGKTLVVLDRDEAQQVADFIAGKMSLEDFHEHFSGKWSEGFDPETDLQRVAVVNQTTMLAEETKQVAGILRDALSSRFGESDLAHYFADTNDTLCYATNWNQNATKALLDAEPDLAVIVGGYNSSNTSHLVEICAQVMPSFLISSADELLSRQRIRHFDLHKKESVESQNWLPEQMPVRIAITSGASCPDVLMNAVFERIADFCGYDAQDIAVGLDRLALHEPLAVG